MKQAKLRESTTCLEDVKTGPQHGIDKALVRRFASCRWVKDHRCILITGATGVGKAT